MQLPPELIELGKKRIESFPVEGFVISKGSSHPTLLLIGEAPGENEIIDGIPFIGRAGDELKKSLESIGLTREDVYMTSAVRSRPFKWGEKKERDGSMTKRKYNRPPTKAEIVAHAPLLDYEIQKIEPKLIVTLGNIGLQRLLGKTAKVTELHGQLIEQPVLRLAELDGTKYEWTKESYRIVPTFHPASVFYRPSLRSQLEADWEEIKRYLKGM